MPDKSLKKLTMYGGGTALEATAVNGVHYVRESDGTWRYADSWIKVPGGRDATLTERFQPKFVLSNDGEVERVAISGVDVEEQPELLGWCVEAGASIASDDGELVEIFVPIELWRERDRIPAAIVAPEHSDNEARRELAEVERKYREADRALEAAASARAEVLSRRSSEMTRQEARDITGLSIGRIQQLIRSETLDDMDVALLEIVADTHAADLEGVRKELANRGTSVAPHPLRERLRELMRRDLIGVDKKGFQMTDDGREALVELKAESDSEVKEG